MKKCECSETVQDEFDSRRNHGAFDCHNEATYWVERDGQALHLCGNCILSEDIEITNPTLKK